MCPSYKAIFVANTSVSVVPHTHSIKIDTNKWLLASPRFAWNWLTETPARSSTNTYNSTTVRVRRFRDPRSACSWPRTSTPLLHKGARRGLPTPTTTTYNKLRTQRHHHHHHHNFVLRRKNGPVPHAVVQRDVYSIICCTCGSTLNILPVGLHFVRKDLSKGSFEGRVIHGLASLDRVRGPCLYSGSVWRAYVRVGSIRPQWKGLSRGATRR